MTKDIIQKLTNEIFRIVIHDIPILDNKKAKALYAIFESALNRNYTLHVMYDEEIKTYLEPLGYLVNVYENESMIISWGE